MVINIICPSTFVEDEYDTSRPLWIDMLEVDFEKGFDLPTISMIPESCHDLTWNIYREMDN